MAVLAAAALAVGSWRSLLHDALIAAALAAAADAVAQRLLGARRLAVRRCALMALYGLLFYGPSNHAWQRLLVHLFHGGSGGGGGGGLFHTVKAAAQRVALDQLTFAPLNNSLMIAYVAVVADRLGWAAARDKVRRELPGVQARGWRFWPAVQAVNQTAVPLRYRVLCNGLAGVCWTAFVITRARSIRSKGSKRPPAFDKWTEQVDEKLV